MSSSLAGAPHNSLPQIDDTDCLEILNMQDGGINMEILQNIREHRRRGPLTANFHHETAFGINIQTIIRGGLQTPFNSTMVLI